MTGATRGFAPVDPPPSIGPHDTHRRRCTATARRTGDRCLKRPIIRGPACGSTEVQPPRQSKVHGDVLPDPQPPAL